MRQGCLGHQLPVCLLILRVSFVFTDTAPAAVPTGIEKGQGTASKHENTQPRRHTQSKPRHVLNHPRPRSPRASASHGPMTQDRQKNVESVPAAPGARGREQTRSSSSSTISSASAKMQTLASSTLASSTLASSSTHIDASWPRASSSLSAAPSNTATAHHTATPAITTSSHETSVSSSLSSHGRAGYMGLPTGRSAAVQIPRHKMTSDESHLKLQGYFSGCVCV